MSIYHGISDQLPVLIMSVKKVAITDQTISDSGKCFQEGKTEKGNIVCLNV